MTEIKVYRGPDEILSVIPEVARLRISVFREWPYLYDGTATEEEDYLGHFAQSKHACVGLARIDGRIVGATTAEPMPSTHAEFQAPFLENGIDPSECFYFGESVLLSAFRRRGIGHAFFDLREKAARDRGARLTAFCAVVRPDDHALKPNDYRPLDSFWISRGYTPRPDLVCQFKWKDVDQSVETSKPLKYWLRSL